MLDLGKAIVDFDTYHRTRGNRLCHLVGVPAIAAAALGALAKLEVPVVGLDAGVLLLAATLLLDLFLNVRIALGVLVLGAALYAGARSLSFEVLAVLFAVGWFFQLVGHRVFERNAPAFVDNVVHLFVGPRWIVNRVVRALPERGRVEGTSPEKADVPRQ